MLVDITKVLINTIMGTALSTQYQDAPIWTAIIGVILTAPL
eukprot:CAMPEP_0119018634 /NCGR_PEP_ID=MMETSP1176-20130426/19908_1 /TAXON_ID=265551 /ORGANISM="Synedropsis recta cf, Strain CCMP1620" /LENGTH=40 /DNA_ID= /DNA_START= /DNA_END= /DNA_ORIENTATION=